MAGIQHDDVDYPAALAEKKGDSSSELSHEIHDGIHDGLIFPTDEERATLRRVADRIPWNAYSKSHSYTRL